MAKEKEKLYVMRDKKGKFLKKDSDTLTGDLNKAEVMELSLTEIKRMEVEGDMYVGDSLMEVETTVMLKGLKGEIWKAVKKGAKLVKVQG